MNVELLAALLEEAGCQVRSTGSAEGALRLAAAERPALILMDAELPGMTGYEATRRLKADPATAGIPVIAVTAQAMRGDEARARAAGCAAYLTKPLDTQAFRALLRRYLGPAGGPGATGERRSAE